MTAQMQDYCKKNVAMQAIHSSTWQFVPDERGNDSSLRGAEGGGE